jgi:cytochrome c553
MPENLERTELRDSASGFIAYVPVGSIEKGKHLASTGGGGKTTQCSICHGADLKGLGPVPALAGRSPSYIVRQLFDFKHGARAGISSALMKPTVDKLTIEDMVALAAFAFGAPGDRGLLCKYDSNTINGGDNLVVFRNGTWFINFAADGATVNLSFNYGSPTDQPLCGTFGAGGFGSLGLFRNGLWFVASNNPVFSFGQSGDVAVYIGTKGSGNLTNRQNVIYGVYRAGTWLLDETGSGAPTTTVNFGGLSQDVPLLIPNWNGLGQYSLAIYRDGTWFIQATPGSPSSVVTVQFGAIGDIPLVRGAH